MRPQRFCAEGWDSNGLLITRADDVAKIALCFVFHEVVTSVKAGQFQAANTSLCLLHSLHDTHSSEVVADLRWQQEELISVSAIYKPTLYQDNIDLVSWPHTTSISLRIEYFSLLEHANAGTIREIRNEWHDVLSRKAAFWLRIIGHFNLPLVPFATCQLWIVSL